MKPMVFNNKIMAPWFTTAFDYLVDRPLTDVLAKSLSSSPDNFLFFQNSLLFQNNFRETPDGYELEVAVPGLNKKDLRLDVADQVLIVQARKQQHNTYGWFTKTNYYQSTQIFEEFVLPDDADATGIRAKCRDGLLKIRIPKLKYENTRKAIPVSGTAETKMNWWQKLTNRFKTWWGKVNNKMRRVLSGF